MPFAGLIFFKDDSAVQAKGAFAPEFHSVGGDLESAPMRREGDLGGLGEFFLAVGDGLAQLGDGVHRLGLAAGPGADLGVAGAGLEVLFGLVAGDLGDGALQGRLSSEVSPVEEHGGAGILGEGLGFSALVVGEEDEGVVLELFEEDGAELGLSVVVGGGERGGFGVDFFGVAGEGKPLGEDVGGMLSGEVFEFAVVFRREFGGDAGSCGNKSGHGSEKRKSAVGSGWES